MKGLVIILLMMTAGPVLGQPVTITFIIGSELGTEMTSVTAEHVATTNGPFNYAEIKRMRFTAILPDSASIQQLHSSGIEIYLNNKRISPIVEAPVINAPKGDSVTNSEASAKVDSVRPGQILFSHYYDQEQWSSTNFIRTLDDRNALKPSNGVSILNTIRARLPNLAMSTSVFQPMGALRAITSRSDQAGYLVDGVPFDGNLVLTNQYNLNTIDFSSISAVSSPNGVALFDLPGGGAFLLKSRDGAGYSKPTFEFNSNVTLAWADASQFGSYLDATEKWLTSNTIAYMQDFGVVNTRVSYNLSTTPLLPGGIDEVPLYHSFKVNTGIEISKRVSVRFILDDRFMSQEAYMGSLHFTKSQSFLQGNVTATYRALNWLDLSMQWVQSRRDSVAGDAFKDTGRERDRTDDRNLWNVFGKFRTSLGEHFSISGLAGFQLTGINENLVSKYYNGAFQSQSNRSTSIGSQSGMGSVDIFYRRLLNASFQFRETLYDSVGSGDRSRSTFSGGLAFNYSELLKWKNLGLGRVRASYGEGNPTPFASYPHPTLSQPRAARLVRNLEVGMDVGLPNSKLELSVNYFSARSNSPLTLGGPSPTQFTLFGESIEDGWEAILQVNPKMTDHFRNRSTLVFSTFQARWIPGSIESYRIVRTGLYNESKWKGFLVSFLLEHYTLASSPEISSLRIRDLTVGFDSGSSPSETGKLSVFVTGRNFVDFFTKADDERTIPLNKSISVGFTVTF